MAETAFQLTVEAVHKDGAALDAGPHARLPDLVMALPNHLIDIQTIYLEPAIEDYARGREILATFPEAERIPVDSHWKIPTLHGNEGSADDWLKIKRNVLVLGVKKSLAMRPN